MQRRDVGFASGVLCRAFLATLITLAAGISASHAGKTVAMDPLADGGNAANWPAYGRTNGEQHYSPLAQIGTRNVERLGLAWALDIEPGNTT
jgi:quinohemoprotein ethanol dehydrogenase